MRSGAFISISAMGSLRISISERGFYLGLIRRDRVYSEGTQGTTRYAGPAHVRRVGKEDSIGPACRCVCGDGTWALARL